jgi:tetratricopeptide (TPR) repeat protein
MSKERFTTAWSAKPPAHSSRLSLRQLWQLPTFALGLAALLVAGAMHPLVWAGHGKHVERALAGARRALEQPHPDIDQAIAKAEVALADPDAVPQQLGEAHLLIGTAYMRRGEQVSENLAMVSWDLARSHLEEAERLGVPEEYELKLAYRLGKTCFKLQADPQRTVDYLARSVREAADDLFEGYALLAQAYLRLPQPDLGGALEAIQRQLAQPQIEESLLAQPRLLCAELYRRLSKSEEARKVLSRIGPDAPPELLFRARLLRARILQEEGLWAEAAQLWEVVKDDPRAANSGPGHILYSLGLCYRKLDRPALAQQAWEAARQYEGEEGQAAAFGLADMRLRGSNTAAALEAFDAALRHLSTPADYHNSLVTLSAARKLIEDGCRWLQQSKDYKASLQLAQLYERLALSGVAAELTGQAAEAWGRALIAQAKQDNPETARQEEEEAREQFRLAGAAFEAVAAAHGPSEKPDWLWRSAKNYLDGQEPARALPVLAVYVTLPGIPLERLGEAYYVRGEAFRSSRNLVAAQADFRHCEKFPGPFAFWARYQLGLIEIDNGNLDEAQAIFEQNLEIWISSHDRGDPQAHEKTLYALGQLLFDRNDFRMASVKLEEALERYPNNPAALKTRFLAGQCALQLAREAGQKIQDAKNAEERDHYQRQRKRFLENASATFQKVIDESAALTATRPVTADEEAMVRQAAFAIADCRFELGQFDDSLRLYEDLVRRYKKQVEELIALQCVYGYYGFVKFQPEQARRTLERLREALAQMPASAFDNSNEVHTRRYWEDFLRDKSRPPN